MVTKVLQGVIQIDVVDTYYFVLPRLTGTALPNALDNSVLEEVYINVNTIEPAELYLPSIASFNGSKNVKIYININILGGTAIIRPYTSESETNYINGSIQYFPLNTFGDTAYLHIVSQNNWMLLYAQSLS